MGYFPFPWLASNWRNGCRSPCAAATPSSARHTPRRAMASSASACASTPFRRGDIDDGRQSRSITRLLLLFAGLRCRQFRGGIGGDLAGAGSSVARACSTAADTLTQRQVVARVFGFDFGALDLLLFAQAKQSNAEKFICTPSAQLNVSGARPAVPPGKCPSRAVPAPRPETAPSVLTDGK